MASAARSLARATCAFTFSWIRCVILWTLFCMSSPMRSKLKLPNILSDQFGIPSTVWLSWALWKTEWIFGRYKKWVISFCELLFFRQNRYLDKVTTMFVFASLHYFWDFVFFAVVTIFSSSILNISTRYELKLSEYICYTQRQVQLIEDNKLRCGSMVFMRRSRASEGAASM